MKGKRGYPLAILVLFAACMGTLTGCQDTPEESAVVSKAEGLSEELIAEPLAEGESQRIELPDRWEETKKWNKDRWIFHTDLKLESVETGNLPIVEIEQYPMTQEELEKLTKYFADGQELYLPRPVSREECENKLNRIQNMEGVYSVYTIDMLMSDTANMLREGIELAQPESGLTDQKADLQFGPKQTDEAEKVIYGIPDETYESYKEPLFFDADIGEKRTSRISARKYDADTGKTSMFEWMEGDKILYQRDDIDLYKGYHTRYADISETDQKWEEILDRCTSMMAEENMKEEEGKKQAETLLKELGIENKIYAYSQPVLWFPAGTYEEDIAYSSYDSLWHADLKQAEPGYVYTFLNEIGGQPVDLKYGGIMLGNPEEGAGGDTYAPSMPVETISIAVTQSGVKMFSWTGMSKEVSVVTENVKLLPFEKIQERIKQYISYCFPGSQPVDNTTLFRYDLEKLTFGYTYIPAYGKPEHVWAVPAWLLDFGSSHNNPKLSGIKEQEEKTWLYVTFNAMDGGVVEAG